MTINKNSPVPRAIRPAVENSRDAKQRREAGFFIRNANLFVIACMFHILFSCKQANHREERNIQDEIITTSGPNQVESIQSTTRESDVRISNFSALAEFLTSEPINMEPGFDLQVAVLRLISIEEMVHIGYVIDANEIELLLNRWRTPISSVRRITVAEVLSPSDFEIQLQSTINDELTGVSTRISELKRDLHRKATLEVLWVDEHQVDHCSIVFSTKPLIVDNQEVWRMTLIVQRKRVALRIHGTVALDPRRIVQRERERIDAISERLNVLSMEYESCLNSKSGK